MPRTEPEPAIGWQQSVERNRLDALVQAHKLAVAATLEACLSIEHIPDPILAEFMADMSFAHGNLDDAQMKLRRGIASAPRG